MTKFNIISDDFSVCGQISLNDIPTIVAAGFKSIICNRPDNEMPSQPMSAGLFEHANEAGLKSAYLPLAMGQLSLELIETTTEALTQLPKPILAYCGSGKRSAALWCFAKAKEQGCESVLQSAKSGGYDLSELRPMLENFSADT